ncbi:phosphonate transport system ATP-binding protein [Comamonas sp. BIGb0124]|uniref:phosphonate ABC transporter ATP-binding protein n=1 Tax=Comamonas sp. BIGb0124 TaxID=2485130 RepID=UPI000F477AFA|nr:phosphonate ABC transporter ATP-binding protein [Comamonas sp. BIGb0124]ROR22735.1 phosphonate transport system ATP-binding protein [Comamonas sp. BIGb0124]
MLEIRALQKRYATGDLALKGIDLSVAPGQVVGLIGPSGAGKSSLIRCINRLVTPSAGEILLDGLDLGRLGGRGLRLARRQIGMIFQEYALVERLTVMENLLSGRLGYTGFWASWFRRFEPQDIEQALRLLERVGLGGMENKRADALSGGQRQRVGIARALMQSPKLLLVDEPTASLDPKTSRQIMRLVLELCRERGLAAIVNIHDVVLATEFLPRIVGLRAGEIVYDGPAARVGPEVLTRIYGDEDWSAISRQMQSPALDDDATDAAEDTARRASPAALPSHPTVALRGSPA